MPTVFVDTNVLVYVRDARDEAKAIRAAEWLQTLWQTRQGRLSYQVLSEYYRTVTERLRRPLPVQQAREDVLNLISWQPVPVDQAVIEGAWRIKDGASCSWWDALIVSAAEVAGCTFLLSEDLQAGCEYGRVRVVDPFQTSVQELLG